MKYRLFTNDVGPEQFSALRDIDANSDAAALTEARKVAEYLQCKVLAIPHSLSALWPNGKTGRISAKARHFMIRSDT